MIGRQVSHYTITSKIGAGGMGEVFLAEDTRLKRRVALKFLPQHFSTNPDVRARFQREAEALAALNHPNIVSVYDVSEFEGRPFIVMEYVEGQTLKEVVATEDLDTDRVVDIVAQIAEGLSAAHAAEIVHRDIKSDNIIITPQNRVKIMDFGLVTWRGVSQLTQEGSTVGTMAYMSPEQAQGKKTDHRTDLWSLGVVLYELLTGRLPFGGDHEAALAYAIMQDEPQPVARYRAEVPPALQDVISRALEKDPEVRYQSASGFIADLKRAKRISDSQLRSYAAQPVVTVAEKPRSKRGLVIGTVAVAVIATILLIVRPWEIVVRPTQEAEAVENRIAVMYFDNLADPDDAERNGEIMANLLMSDLSGSSYLQVVSSQRLYDVLKQLGKEGVKTVDRETATQVAEKAHAKWMLTGSILRTSPNIVVTAQLVDVATGTMLTSPRITGDAGADIFAIVDNLSAEIKSHLTLPAEAMAEGDRAVTELTTSSTDAYRHYLKGQEYLFQYKFRDAEAEFNKAIAADSIFAMAYYGLSWVATERPKIRQEVITRAKELSGGLSQLDRWKILAREASLFDRPEEEVELLKRVLAADPEDKQAYRLLGLAYRSWPFNDYEMSTGMFKKVIAIDSLDKDAYNHLAYDFERLGMLDSSIWAINRYIELAPNEPNPYDSRAELYGFAGNTEAAIASYRKALEIDSTFVESYQGLLEIQTLVGNYAAAERIIQGGMRFEDRLVRRDARRDRALIALHQGRWSEYLNRKRIAEEATRLEFGTDLREMWSYSSLFYDYLMMERLTHDAKWLDSATVQLELFGEAFARDTLTVKRDTLTFREMEFRLQSRKGDTVAARSALDAYTALLDTTTSSDRRDFGIAMSDLHFDQGHYDSCLFYEQHYVPENNSFGQQFWRGRIFLLAGRYGDAVAKLERAERRYDGGRFFNAAGATRLHYYLGRAYEESGWIDKAIAQYEIFAEKWRDADPGIVDLEDARVRLARLRPGT